MESGLFRDFFGNFSTRGERYYFCMEGSMQGEIETNIRELRKTQISFLGGGYLWWVRWGMWNEVCEVGFGWRGPLVGRVGYARWGMQGRVCKVRYMRWDLHKVRFMQGEFYTRWDMWGERYDVRVTWGEIYASHLVTFFTPWYFPCLIKFKQ